MGFFDLFFKRKKHICEDIAPSLNLEEMKAHIMLDFYSDEEKECIVEEETGNIALDDTSKIIKLE